MKVLDGTNGKCCVLYLTTLKKIRKALALGVLHWPPLENEESEGPSGYTGQSHSPPSRPHLAF